jgi:UDP-N-acetylmuramate dehydrogenase
MNRQQKSRLEAVWQEKIRWDVDMAAHCTLRAGGRAAGMIDIATEEELSRLLAQLGQERLGFMVIGRGSNVLVSDRGYEGIIIRLTGDFETVHLVGSGSGEEEERLVRVGAGCMLAGLLSWCGRNNLGGLAFLAGIPGTVGGALFMNAGAWGHAMGEMLAELSCMDSAGRMHGFGPNELVMEYRSMQLKRGSLESMIITSALLRMPGCDGEEFVLECRKIIEKRRGRQPGGVASAGSFFKNPPGDAAGRLIEAAGLKGERCGGALVSPVHANFIVNTGGATASDILALVQRVRERVQRKFGVLLEPEVKIIRG